MKTPSYSPQTALQRKDYYQLICTSDRRAAVFDMSWQVIREFNFWFYLCKRDIVAL